MLFSRFLPLQKRLFIFSCFFGLFMMSMWILIPPANAGTLQSHSKTANAPTSFALIPVNSAFDIVAAGDGQCTLREAINNANLPLGGDTTGNDCPPGAPGVDTINLIDPNMLLFPNPVYQLAIPGPGENGNVTGDLDITDMLNIQGAGMGVTIIDGTGIGDRLFHVDPLGVGYNVQFRGITIQNGASGFPLPAGGGGIYNLGRLTLQNSAVRGNVAVNGGGIMNAGMVNIFNSEITDNQAQNTGGGIRNDGVLQINKSFVIGNQTASAALGDDGGGIWNGGQATIDESIVENNKAIDGAGIFSQNQLTINKTTISFNMAQNNGGGLHETAGAIIANSTFSNNTAQTSGGGIFTIGGGAVVFLDNSTVAMNMSGAPEGGLSIQPASTLNLKNSLIAQNVPLECGIVVGALVTFGYNIDTDGSCLFAPVAGDIPGAGIPAINLLPLTMNGGFAPTHMLGYPSIAIDMASPACTNIAGAVIPDDQRNVIRPIDGNGDGVLTCDIGAVEVRPAQLDVAKLGIVDNPASMITYTILISNSGDIAATSTVTDSFPAGISNVTCVETINGVQTTLPPGNVAYSTVVPAMNFATISCIGEVKLVTVEKTIANPMVTVGSPATFTLNFNNVTGVTQTVTVQDPLAPACAGMYNVPSAGLSTNCQDPAVSGSYTNILTMTADIAVTNVVSASAVEDFVPIVHTAPVVNIASILITDTAMVTVVLPAVTPTLSITFTGTTAELSWTTDPANCSYELHEDTAPYFIPSAGTLLTTTTGGSYNHLLAIGDPATNHYYYVKAINCSSVGDSTALSNHVGEFDFAIVPGT